MPRLVDIAAGRACMPAFRYSSVSIPNQKMSKSVKRAKRRFPGITLTKEELRNIRLALGPTLSLEQAATHAHLASDTLKKKLCEGFFRDCVKRNKPLVFLTERFFQELFRGSAQ